MRGNLFKTENVVIVCNIDMFIGKNVWKRLQPEKGTACGGNQDAVEDYKDEDGKINIKCMQGFCGVG